MIFCSRLARLAVYGFSFNVIATRCMSAPPPQAGLQPDFRQILEKIASLSPDPCDPPVEAIRDSSDIESSAFDRAADIVTESLNAAAGPGSALETVTDTLRRLQQMSTEVNAAWPEESRFRFEVLNLPPLLVVTMGLRTNETFFVFGRPEDDKTWHRDDTIEGVSSRTAARRLVEIYPLHRGPLQNPRFLAQFNYVGCAGSSGVAYVAHEWNPKNSGSLHEIIKQTGSFGLDDKVPGFEKIGKLNTEGPFITLPYCWFSPIDTWDNPSLCSVDTYNLSGDDVSFVSHKYNRPDLVPIARALEYAEQRDYPAVLAYCAFAEVARTLVSEVPPDFFADELTAAQTGYGKESVELGVRPKFRFDVELRGGRWKVVAFSTR
jgi:hypothetical protein